MESRPVVTVLYGSQTGNAQDVAELIGREAKRCWFTTRVVSMKEYDVSQLPSERVALFVCSTTGVGEAPDTMKAFWRFLLRRSLGADSLSEMQFSTCGLGDSSYDLYNMVGKRLHKRILQLGGQELHPIGLGDDQSGNGLYDGVDPWLKNILDALLQKFPLPPGREIKPANTLPPPRYRVTVVNSPPESVAPVSSSPPYDIDNPFTARVIKNDRLTPESHFQEVRHLEFDIEGSGIQFAAGEVMCVTPENLPGPTDEFIKYIGYDPDAWISVEPAEHDAPKLRLPNPCRLREACLKYLNIFGTPRRYFFELLSHFAADENEKDRLQYFGSSEATDDLYRYNQREHRTVFECLQDFPSARPPLEYLFDLVNPQQPRWFSISSSQSMHPNTISLTVAIVKYQTPYKRPRTGVCTSWFSSMDLSQQHVKVPIWVVPGEVGVPADVTRPLTMVGTGTGCAPFRSIMQDLSVRKKAGQPVGKVRFIFGCRNEAKDFYYAEEMRRYADQGLITLVTAFSRDSDNKVYVQNRIEEHGAVIAKELLEEDGFFFVSGAAGAMPREVAKAVANCFVSHAGMDLAQAEATVKQLKTKKKYLVEAWF